jgi:hypothetical protein
METALCFITIYCSCYFNIYGARLSCELTSPSSLRSESLRGRGRGFLSLFFWLLPYLLKIFILRGAPFVLRAFLDRSWRLP